MVRAESGAKCEAGFKCCRVGMVVALAIAGASGCGKSGGRTCTRIVIWNANDSPITEAVVKVGRINCPGGYVAPAGAAGSDGFAIQKYDNAFVSWVAQDGVRHEATIDLKQALSKPLCESEVWFKVGDEDNVAVVVVAAHDDPRFVNTREKRSEVLPQVTR